ncbi:MAG TPA: zinc ribbon domain-containing protein [Anaerolineales bacterium]|nr:zinc ribbon domain-containing protein [Anaerolineales bacterium]
MPIYTYRCESCGVQFEREQSFSDAPLKICPECRKKSLKKVISPVGVIFKGSGFYATDHKSPSGTGSSTPAKKDDAKPEKKAESKPAEKGDS